MPQFTIYHLTFAHGLHIGRGGVQSLEESLDFAPSDTLFAALFNTAIYLGANTSQLLEVLRITSAFPFAGNVRFYPKPVDSGVLLSDAMLRAEGASKRIKKIRYISEGLLEKARHGKKLDEFLFPEDEDVSPTTGVALQGGIFWLLTEEVENLPERMRFYEKNGQKIPRPLRSLRQQRVFMAQMNPRVTVDRINSASTLFQSERVSFNKDCGLWFAASKATENLPLLLQTLGENGLGGERTAGYGHFTYQEKGILDVSAPQGCAYLLSRWHPANEIEIALLKKENSAYKLEAISGWLHTAGTVSQRRKRLWMVAEGSLIDGNPQGNVTDVRPDYGGKPGVEHPIYRAGFAVALNWQGRNK